MLHCMADIMAQPMPGVLQNGHSASVFGHAMREHFLFDKHFINLNHGSFGAFPLQVRASMRKFQDLTEARPDPFIRYDYPKLLDQSRQLMADYLHAPVEEIVFVPNATNGINTVLRNIRFKEGDVILYCATMYGSCEKTIDYLCETTSATSVKVEYTYPLSDEMLVELFQETIRQVQQDSQTVKVAVFDVIASLPGVHMPFEQLTAVCKEEGVLSLIDGAHAPGQVTLNLSALGPDFFVGNCHKWLFAPRGCAVLYVPIKHQALIRSSLPTSHGFVPMEVEGKVKINNPLPPSDKSDFANQFEFTGALDNSPFLCIPTCFDFLEHVCGGEKAYRTYCNNLAHAGGKAVAKILGTETMDNEAGTLSNCFFSNVRLPLYTGDGTNAIRVEDRNEVTNWLLSKLMSEYDTFMALTFHGGSWWVRLSAQIYLDQTDFVWAGEILKALCQRVGQGEYRKSNGVPN